MLKMSVFAAAIGVGFVVRVAAQTSLSDGLVAYYTFNGNAHDESGNANDGTVYGASFVGPGSAQLPGGLLFDGSDDRVEVPDSASLRPAEVSVAAWVRFDSLTTARASRPGLQYLVFKKNVRSADFEGYALCKFEDPDGLDRLQFVVSSESGVQVAASSASIVRTGCLYQVVGTYDQNAVKLYVNGALEADLPAGFPPSYDSTPLMLGESGQPFEGRFEGLLADVRIYNRALSAAEADALYLAGTSLVPAQTVVVSGQACIYFAAQTAASLATAAATLNTGAAVYYFIIDAQTDGTIPPRVPISEFATSLRISASGTWGHGPTYTSEADGIDGSDTASLTPYNYFGIGLATYRLNQLVAIFLDAGGNPLGSVMGLGTGPIDVPVPTGAAQICFGMHDAYEWANNWGSVTVTVQPRSGALAAMSNVRANQRPGTRLVDVLYNLGGNGSSLSVSAAVSSDGGTTFGIPATHFSGDGVTSPTAPGAGLHIVWDAGADLGSGYFPNVVVRLSAGGSSAASGVFPVDLRGLSGGLAVSGRALDAASHQPLAGVSISLAAQNTTTLSDGTFSLADVSLASGTSLTANLSGYLPASLTVAPPPGASVAALPDILLHTTPSGNRPVVTSLNPNAEPVYISGWPITHDFTATVNWNGGTPGTVDFYANGQVVKSLTGAGPSYTVTLDSTPFSPSLAVGGNTVSVVAENGGGTASKAASVFVYDVPYPQPLPLIFPPSSFLSGSPPTVLSASATWPDPAWSTPTLSLPVIGKFGLSFQVNPHLQYNLSDGDWEVGMGDGGSGDNLTLNLGQDEVSGTLSLDASGHLSPSAGFTDTQIAVALSLGGTFQVGEFGLLDLLGPGISDIVSGVPVVGNAVSAVSIEVDAAPQIGGDLNLSFPQFQFQNATFNGSIAITANYEPELWGLGTLKAYVGGTPSLTFQVPSQPPGGFLQQAQFTAYAGLDVDTWVYKWSGEYVFLDLSWPSSSQNAALQSLVTGQWIQVPTPHFGRPGIVARPNLWSGSEGFAAYDARPVAQVSEPAVSPTSQSAGSVASRRLARLETRDTSRMSGLEAFRAMGRGAGRSRSGPRPLDLGSGGGSLAQADLTLVTNAFPNNEPAMDAFGQELMLLYVADNGNTNNLSFTEIRWTRFDGTNWSTPLPIQANAAAQFDPQVKYDANGNALAVWDEVNDPNFDQTNLTALAADMEVYWSWWDRASGTWSRPAALTANNYLDHAPLLCGPMSDGSLLLTWVANASNLLMGTNGAGSQVFWSQWNPASQAWSTPQTLIGGVTYQLSQSLSGAGNLAVYAWSQDTVGTLTNPPDDQVFYSVWTNGVWGATTAFEANTLGNRNARVAVSPSGDVYWVWQQGTNLVMSTNFSASQTLVRADSQTAGFSDFAMTLGPADNLFLLWQGMTTNGCHAHYAVYDPVSATWSQDELLRDDPPLERSFAPVWDSAGNLTVAYDVVDVFDTNITATLNGGTVVTITNVPQPGEVDIAVTKRALIKDLALLPGGFTAKGNNYLQGDAVTLTANVQNLGDLGMSNVVVSFYDGNPDSGGILISNVTLAGWLPGAATDGVASASWVVPDSSGNHVLYAVVDQTNAAAEFNPGNNTQSVSVGGTDLAVSLVSYNALTNGSVRVIAQVQNLGAPAATNSVLAIRSYGQIGAPLTTAQVPALDPGQLAQVALDLPVGTQPTGEATYQLFADDTRIVPDVNTNNNVAAFSVVLWAEGVEGIINVSASPAGGGTLSGGGTVTVGSEHTVAAVANPGFQFVDWTENGTEVSTNASYTFTVSDDRTLVANLVQAPQMCPADTDANSRIVISEVTAYGAAWKRGDTWVNPPNPIPISYVTRVGYLWKNGECYGFDQSQDPPLCWVLQPCPQVVGGAGAQAAGLGSGAGAAEVNRVGVSSVVRSVEGATVSLQATPDASVSVYAVEEDLPGGLTPYDITEGGTWDAANRKVKWGPFFDNAARTLSYSVSGVAGVYPLSGVASYDGVNLETSGGATIDLESTLRLGDVGIGLSGQGLTFTFSTEVGRQYYIEYTDNLSQGRWQVVAGPLTGTDGRIRWTDDGSKSGGVPPASGPRFYRVRSSP